MAEELIDGELLSRSAVLLAINEEENSARGVILFWRRMVAFSVMNLAVETSLSLEEGVANIEMKDGDKPLSIPLREGTGEPVGFELI